MADATRVRPWVPGVAVVAAAFLGGVALLPGHWLRSVLVGCGLAVVTAVAMARRSAPAMRAAVFVDLVFAGYAAGAHGGWPPAVTVGVVCVAPLAALLACDRVPRLRPAAPWLRWGRLSSEVAWLAMVTVAASSAALVWWARSVHPTPAPYFRDLRDLPWWVGVAGVLGAALINPIWEEALFRGVVLTELAALWGTLPSVVVQAAATGFAHLNGFPSGWSGMAMAATWGLVLGWVRVRTGGIAVPYAIHVFADATVGTLGVLLLV
ncbi:CPBP family intramembrane glutamic endopeptidase [Pseudonocardia acaciae]|uniref:CPBP family intramembrane glutamic endopeptidase n=1 Tax=Pseudonocardia acaciae TaxID=551276 RepID=UPI001B7FF668|nr:CPBP family intramembrane glutamic endopeptidase [Pseudonocardia acaciae]